MPTGRTKGAGWQIGVSRTIDAPLGVVWDLLTSDAGVAIWLGPGASLPLVKGDAYATADGIRGELRSYHREDRIRLTWHPVAWSHDSTVQVAVAPKGARTVIRFHQERLADSDERVRQREYWTSVLDRFVGELSSG